LGFSFLCISLRAVYACTQAQSNNRSGQADGHVAGARDTLLMCRGKTPIAKIASQSAPLSASQMFHVMRLLITRQPTTPTLTQPPTWMRTRLPASSIRSIACKEDGRAPRSQQIGRQTGASIHRGLKADAKGAQSSWGASLGRYLAREARLARAAIRSTARARARFQ
jgi:hypothetical protein